MTYLISVFSVYTKLETLSIYRTGTDHVCPGTGYPYGADGLLFFMRLCGIDTAKAVLHTGQIGDGKVFVYDIENVVKIRTGEEGFLALQDTDA